MYYFSQKKKRKGSMYYNESIEGHIWLTYLIKPRVTIVSYT